MSDPIKHECGLAMIRLKKPLEFYQEKYGSPFYGLNKLQLLMQKKKNRGQDGAGIATIKLNVKQGDRYISRKREVGSDAIQSIFGGIMDKHFKNLSTEKLRDASWLKATKPYMGELLLGHLRYGTHGVNSVEACHPFIRQNNWLYRNLVVAGNFNLTNVDELFGALVELGQHPKEKSDTVTVMEKIGHFLDDEVERLFTWHKADHSDNQVITQKIIEELDVLRVLRRASKDFDGGYAMAGMIGHGDAFVMRDPAGIRPACYFENDEIVVVASERPAIQTAFNVPLDEIHEIKPAHALIIRKNGSTMMEQYIDALPRKSCSFESIYFARPTDAGIYVERKKMGEILAKPILDAVNYNMKNTIFSFIPNSAETAFYGLIKGIEQELNIYKKNEILKRKDKLSGEDLAELLSISPRVEKLVIKDTKVRTFIADDASRGDLVLNGYDVTYGLVEKGVDTLVLMDDSIVRGTTMRDSIIKILARLSPKKIILVSSAPQIRFPDCYGIDMSVLNKFVAFKALLALLENTNQNHLLEETYKKCKAQEKRKIENTTNEVTALYNTFSYDEITAKIAEIITPDHINPEVQVIYQSVDGIHQSCPRNMGDWYFTGDYPTPGGNRVANRSFINFMEGIDKRAY